MCQGARKCLVPAISEESRGGADGGSVARRKHPPSAHTSRLLIQGGTPSPLDRRSSSSDESSRRAPASCRGKSEDSGPQREKDAVA